MGKWSQVNNYVREIASVTYPLEPRSKKLVARIITIIIIIIPVFCKLWSWCQDTRSVVHWGSKSM